MSLADTLGSKQEPKTLDTTTLKDNSYVSVHISCLVEGSRIQL